MGEKKKAEDLKLKTSVKSYHDGIDVEAKKISSGVRSLQKGFKEHSQKMMDYTKKMGGSVRSLQKGFKEHSKDLHAAVLKMNGNIRNQIKENKEAAALIGNGVKFILSEINKKKKDFGAYSKAFWG